MGSVGHNSAAARFRSFIERIERLEEERKAIADGIAEVYAELKGEGFDKEAAKTILKIRKTEDGLSKWTERSAIVDTYLVALGMLPDDEPRAPACARENIEEFPPHDPETGEIAETAGDAIGAVNGANAGLPDANSVEPSPAVTPSHDDFDLGDIPEFLRRTEGGYDWRRA